VVWYSTTLARTLQFLMIDSHEPDRLLVIVVEKNKEVFRQAAVHYTSVICDVLTGIRGQKCMDGPERRARDSSSPEGRKCKWAMAWLITVLVMRITKAVGLPHPTATAANGSHHAPLQAFTETCSDNSKFE